jgi:HNH endonuclease
LRRLAQCPSLFGFDPRSQRVASMPQAEAFRELVVGRAGGACEYCRLVQAAAGVTFHLEHIQPRSAGGKTSLNNLALSCPGCNFAKAERVTAIDKTGQVLPLFNPRDYEPSLLGWHLHFELDRASGIIVPRTRLGEVTLETLRMNDSLRAFARRLQIQAGLIA